MSAPAAVPTKTKCATCGLTVKGKTCNRCVKQDIPQPGTPAYERWRSGISKMVYRRLNAAGIDSFENLKAAWTWVCNDGPEPSEEAVRAALADVKAVFISPRRFWQIVDREVAKIRAAERAARPRIVPPPVRVELQELPRVRIDVGTTDEAAEHEAEAVAVEQASGEAHA